MPNAATLKPDDPKPSAPALVSASASQRAYAMLSHRGRVRHANQDACAALPEIGAFVLCDGMGGAAAGEVASRLASEAFLNALSDEHPRSARSATSNPASPTEIVTTLPGSHPHTRLTNAIRAANQTVYRHSRTSQNLHGMGTTLVTALLDDQSAEPAIWIAHVGDSRCYRLRRGNLELLTLDHSLVEEQIQAGLLSRAQAESSPIRNIITRALGSQPEVEPDIAAHQILPGDLYLLASDGLTRELRDVDIARILTRASGPTLEPACRALVDAANAHGGHDNITVLLISCN